MLHTPRHLSLKILSLLSSEKKTSFDVNFLTFLNKSKFTRLTKILISSSYFFLLPPNFTKFSENDWITQIQKHER